VHLIAKIVKTGIATEVLQATDPAALEIGRALEDRIKKLLGRALAIREVDAGSCNGCELEIAALAGAGVRHGAVRDALCRVTAPR
jgi:hypothetical protein